MNKSWITNQRVDDWELFVFCCWWLILDFLGFPLEHLEHCKHPLVVVFWCWFSFSQLVDRRAESTQKLLQQQLAKLAPLTQLHRSRTVLLHMSSYVPNRKNSSTIHPTSLANFVSTLFTIFEQSKVFWKPEACGEQCCQTSHVVKIAKIGKKSNSTF